MIVKLTGRIDSTNASAVEEALNQEINGFSGEIILDASGLEYISSAGLRVILRIKKSNPDTKIINCKLDVYEIFDMTGFTEMMEISKAYREISIEGCEVIGEGANGIVYRTDPDTIVKLYKNPDSLADIQHERELARKAFVMGIPTAIPYDVVKVGELYGSVFELLNAKSFAMLIREGANVEQLAKESVDILKIIHSTTLKPGELPNKKEEVLKWAEFAKPYLSAEVYGKVMKLVNDVPNTNNMLHGDYHIKNIMKQNNENLLIDMDTLALGHPIFEFSEIYGAYLGYSCIDKNNSAAFLGIERNQCQDLWKYTLKYYFEGRDEDFIKEVERKAAFISYLHIFRWMVRRFGLDDPYASQVSAYCLNFINENVKTLDSLWF
ncbi:MAG: STAS domain-containing protein [Bacilli bacterium]|nr:STAS domain-containing protein [Bacilli bacterium]